MGEDRETARKWKIVNRLRRAGRGWLRLEVLSGRLGFVQRWAWLGYVAEWVSRNITYAALLSLASLLVSWIAFYKVHLRGADIWLQAASTDPVRHFVGHWSAGFPQGWGIECKLLVTNEGPRTETLEGFRLERDSVEGSVTVTPRAPRTFVIVGPSVLMDEKRHGLPQPLIVRDGDMVTVYFRMEFHLNAVSLGQYAKDVRELNGISVRYAYIVGSRGKLKKRNGMVQGSFDPFKASAREMWRTPRADRAWDRALAILDGTDPAEDI